MNANSSNDNERGGGTGLNMINYANVVAFILNVVVTYGIGTAGLFGSKTNTELSEKYQSLVTPAGWAFAIWGIIFLSEAIFTVAQLLPYYRADPLVQNSIQYYFVYTCLAQVLWTLLFSFEQILGSLFAMTAILVALLIIVYRQRKSDRSISPKEYWLLKFPFAIHAGWIVAAFFVNLNVVFVAMGASGKAQISVAAFSLLCVFLGGLYALNFEEPEFVVTAVLVWATFGITMELRNPKDSILFTFSLEAIRITRNAAAIVSASLLLTLLVRTVQSSRRRGSGAESERLTYNAF